MGAARGQEDLAQEQAQGIALDTVEVVVGTDQVGVALDRHPLPPRPQDGGEAGPGPEVTELGAAPLGDEAEHGAAVDRVFEDSCVDHRRLYRAVGPGGRDHRQPVIPRNHRPQLLHALVDAHGATDR